MLYHQYLPEMNYDLNKFQNYRYGLLPGCCKIQLINFRNFRNQDLRNYRKPLRVLLFQQW